jgi:hypothetical protein
MSSLSSNLLSFSVDFILGIKKKSGGDKSEEYESDLILESLVLPKTALLILQVSCCHARGTSSLFPEPEVLLNKFFESNEKILPLPSSKESFDNQLKSIHELFQSCQVFDGLLNVHCIIFEILMAVPKSCIPFKNPCTRDSIVTITLLYKLESFNSCFAGLKTKLNVCSLLHHYELSQRSAWHKILNMTQHE